MLLGEDERRRGVGDHVGDAVSRIVRIDGQIGAAGLQHAEQSDDHLEGALDAKADDHIRADAERLQMMRQPIGAFVQLAIGELRAFIDQRDSLRVPRRLRLEHLVQKPVLRIVRRGVVPFHQQAMAFVLRQNVQFADAAIRIARYAVQQRAIMPRHPIDRARLEQSRRIFERRCETIVGFRDRQREIELGARPFGSERLEAQPRDRGGGLGGILQGEHHLEQRIAAHVADRPQVLDETLERQVLMRLSAERGLANPRQQDAEARIAGQIGAHHQRVHEEADQLLELETTAIGDRRADADVALPAVARQEKLKRREQRHEQRRAFLASEGRQSVGDMLGDREGQTRSGVILPRRSRMIGRKIEGGRSAAELVAPIGELAIEDLASQPIPLPDRVIGILNGELRQRRRPPGEASLVESDELAQENAGGPSVGHDVVHCEQYDALALCSRGTDTEIERLHPQQRACGEIEWATRFLGGEAQRFRLPHLLVERAEIDDRRLDLEPGGDHLGRGAVAKDEGGAEHVVPPDDLIDGEGEGLRVEIADDAQCGRYVVGGVPGLELIEKPQSLLREGERQRRGARDWFDGWQFVRCCKECINLRAVYVDR
ncbi:hypothetical+protein [Methylocapsa aurea]